MWKIMAKVNNTGSVLNHFSSCWQKRMIRFGIYIGIAFCLFLFLLPVGTKLYLTKWLLAHGADEAVVQDVNINIFKGTASLSGVEISKNDRSVFSNSIIYLDLKLLNLFNREAFLQKASIADITLDIEQYENGRLRIGSYNFERKEESASQQPESLETAVPWIFRATKLDLSNITVHYKQPKLQVEFVVDKGVLERFNTDPDGKSGSLSLTGKINGAPITLDLATLSVSPSIVLDGSIAISKIQLKNWSNLLQDVVAPLNGTVDAEGKIHFESNSDKIINAKYAGNLNLSDAEISSRIYEIAGKNASWRGAVHYQQDEKNDVDIDIDGTLLGKSLKLDLPEQSSIQVDGLTLAIEPELKINVGKKLVLEGGGNLLAENFKLFEPGKIKPFLFMENFEVSGLKAAGEQNIAVNKIAANEIKFLRVDKSPIQVLVGNVTLNNLVTSDLESVSIDQFFVEEPLFAELYNNSQPGDAEKITVNIDRTGKDALVNAFDTSEAKGEVSGNALANRQQFHDSSSSILQASNINWSKEKGLFLESIDINSILTGISKVKSLEEHQIEESDQESDKTEKNIPENEIKAIPQIRIKSISVGENSVFDFTDNTFARKFHTSLQVRLFDVVNIDSTQPDKLVNFQLEGTFDKYAPIKIKGSGTLFSENFYFEQNIELKNYSMQNLSPYVVNSIGTVFDSGQLNLFSNLTINDDILDSNNNVIIKNISVRAVNEELQQNMNNRLPVPLDMALTILKDKKGEIDLDIPITGKLAELNVGIADVILTAMSKSIIVGVTPYLAYTFLGPTGALVYLGVKAGEALINTGLPELEYQTGITDLSKEQETILTNIGEVIKKDKESEYTICSRIALWELEGEIEKTFESQQKILNDESKLLELRKLGEERSHVVKEYLISQFEINKKRLHVCNPGLNFDKEGTGIVHFLK